MLDDYIVDEYDVLVKRFSEMLGFYGEDPDEAAMIIDAAIAQGFSMKDIKRAYKDAKSEYV